MTHFSEKKIKSKVSRSSFQRQHQQQKGKSVGTRIYSDSDEIKLFEGSLYFIGTMYVAVFDQCIIGE